MVRGPGVTTKSHAGLGARPRRACTSGATSAARKPALRHEVTSAERSAATSRTRYGSPARSRSSRAAPSAAGATTSTAATRRPRPRLDLEDHRHRAFAVGIGAHPGRGMARVLGGAGERALVLGEVGLAHAGGRRGCAAARRARSRPESADTRTEATMDRGPGTMV